MVSSPIHHISTSHRRFLRCLFRLIGAVGVFIGALPLGHTTEALQYLARSDSWFNGEEGQRGLDNLLSWQTSFGDWPKNRDPVRRRFDGELRPKGTFDNGATTSELRLLAKAIEVTQDTTYKEAFQRGLSHILAAQYPNGGWPQRYPLEHGYSRHITFNDQTMVRILELLRDCSDRQGFGFLDEATKARARAAWTRGVQCILDTQIMVDGRLTVWCAQHDAHTLEPAAARSYEHISLSGGESAGILLFLMDLEHPDARVRHAIDSGIAWFDQVMIEGMRYVRHQGDRVLQPHEEADPLWARFYEIDTFRPIFSDRDGVVRYGVRAIGAERRNGYAWYGSWGSRALRRYSQWQDRVGRLR